ncbi:hypothetical protein Cri9333_4853 (plasmid) [Crinalium epipsammum PCC 9333]|uniref:Uncharacterized protein n=1 Tax=Crinalium epipsammum PCC 9333 TaxID=1173022 RepID=K9W755_9CYAN|nr:hypothetical protein [Crinalium epipsammum]AFZ15619.1 hypothetical protein Cri9333_4853 [Crinalium epipsammum PCC 9333]
MSQWSQATQMDNFSGLWYKFKQDSNGNWHILCSSDKNSLESQNIIYHDHYWQSNGRWYCQGRQGNKHTMNGDSFIEGIERQNQIASLDLTDAEKQELNLTSGALNRLTPQQVKKLADYRACQAYGNAGYGGTDRGVEVSLYEADIFERLVKQHQSSTSTLTWRDAEENRLSVTESAKQTLNWRDATPDINSRQPTQARHQCSHQIRKSTRKMTR